MLGCATALEHRTPQAVAAGLDETLVEALTRWPTDPGFDSRTRACLGYAEQILIDARGWTTIRRGPRSTHWEKEGSTMAYLSHCATSLFDDRGVPLNKTAIDAGGALS